MHSQWVRVADTLYSESLTFNDWNVFVEAFPKDINRHHQFRIHKETGHSYHPTQLDSIVGRMVKLNTNLVTFLCIVGYDLTFDHLMALVKIPKLTGLVLERLHSEVDRRQIADWGRAACEKGTLQSLKLLVVRSCSIGRDQILLAVAKLPSLCLVGFPTNFVERSPTSYGCWQLITSLW
jgi:hypothetical protein